MGFEVRPYERRDRLHVVIEEDHQPPAGRLNAEITRGGSSPITLLEGPDIAPPRPTSHELEGPVGGTIAHHHDFESLPGDVLAGKGRQQSPNARRSVECRDDDADIRGMGPRLSFGVRHDCRSYLIAGMRQP